MERGTGDEFDFLGYRLKVEKSKSCDGCFFFQHALDCYHDEIRVITGECMRFVRQYNDEVIFKEI